MLSKKNKHTHICFLLFFTMATTNIQYSTIACGLDHSVVLLSDGTVRCWCNNKYNQCNPLHSTFTNVVHVACGSYHSVALFSNGTIQCWGNNYHNQCDPVHLTFTDVMIPCNANTCILW